MTGNINQSEPFPDFLSRYMINMDVPDWDTDIFAGILHGFLEVRRINVANGSLDLIVGVDPHNPIEEHTYDNQTVALFTVASIVGRLIGSLENLKELSVMVEEPSVEVLMQQQAFFTNTFKALNVGYRQSYKEIGPTLDEIDAKFQSWIHGSGEPPVIGQETIKVLLAPKMKNKIAYRAGLSLELPRDQVIKDVFDALAKLPGTRPEMVGPITRAIRQAHDGHSLNTEIRSTLG